MSVTFVNAKSLHYVDQITVNQFMSTKCGNIIISGFLVLTLSPWYNPAFCILQSHKRIWVVYLVTPSSLIYRCLAIYTKYMLVISIEVFGFCIYSGPSWSSILHLIFRQFSQSAVMLVIFAITKFLHNQIVCL